MNISEQIEINNETQRNNEVHTAML